MLPLAIQMRYKTHAYSVTGVFGINDEVWRSPLANCLAKEITELVRSKCDAEISLMNHFSIANRIAIIIDKINYSYQPIRAVVCSANGLEAAASIRDDILRRFDNAFACLNVHELYELRTMDKERYDYVIINMKELMYKYDWPYFVVSVQPTLSQMNGVYNEVILSGVPIQKTVDELDFPEIKVYNDFEYETAGMFAKLLSFKLGRDNENIKAINEEIEKVAAVATYGKTCVLILPTELIGKNILEVYVLKDSGLWKCKKIEFIVVVSLDFENDLLRIKLINQLLHQIVLDKDNLRLLIEKPDKETFRAIVKKGLITIPISLT